MKVVIATLLFISAAEAIRNLVGLPETRSTRLHHLLKGKYLFLITTDNSGLMEYKDDICLNVGLNIDNFVLEYASILKNAAIIYVFLKPDSFNTFFSPVHLYIYINSELTYEIC